MSFVGMELWTGRTMGRVWTAIGFTLYLRYLNLGSHHFSSVRLLFLHTVGVVFGLEAAQVDLYILFRHREAFVSEKLLDSVNINSLFDHIRGYCVPELVCRYQIRQLFVLEVGSQFLESRLNLHT